MNKLLTWETFSNQLMIQKARQEILVCNEISERFGLTLHDDDIDELVACRAKALRDTGRIEFEGGILPKLIYAFCDSPFIEQENYREVLEELQEAFYFYKNESEDAVTDDELIDYMVKVFNGRAHGSTEYLIGTSLDALCRYGSEEYDPEDADCEEDLF